MKSLTIFKSISLSNPFKFQKSYFHFQNYVSNSLENNDFQLNKNYSNSIPLKNLHYKKQNCINNKLTKKSFMSNRCNLCFINNKKGRVIKPTTFNKFSKKLFFGGGGREGSKKDYYKSLGLDKNASKSEIKSAFFKLAKEWHPDRNKNAGAKEKFAEISEAYEILGDENRKQVYDQTGMTSEQQTQQNEFNKQWGGGNAPGGNPFENMFKGGAQNQQGGEFHGFWEDLEQMFGGSAPGSEGKDSKKGRDILTNIEITFMEAIEGCQKTVAFDRTSVCTTCNGTKAKPGTGQTKCSTCGGSGKVVYRQGFMTIAMQCNSCGGQGSVIKNPCTHCYGKGSMTSKVTEQINIPKGVDEGVKLRVARKGHYSSNGQNGDLFINVKIRPHPYFRRAEYDIHTNNKITVSQAVLGAKIKIKTIQGEALITVDPGTQDGDVKKLNNYGISKLNSSSNQKGHHYVKFKVVVPKTISSQEKELYEKLSQIEEKPADL